MKKLAVIIFFVSFTVAEENPLDPDDYKDYTGAFNMSAYLQDWYKLDLDRYFENATNVDREIPWVLTEEEESHVLSRLDSSDVLIVRSYAWRVSRLGINTPRIRDKLVSLLTDHRNQPPGSDLVGTVSESVMGSLGRMIGVPEVKERRPRWKVAQDLMFQLKKHADFEHYDFSKVLEDPHFQKPERSTGGESPTSDMISKEGAIENALPPKKMVEDKEESEIPLDKEENYKNWTFYAIVVGLLLFFSIWIKGRTQRS